MRLHEVLQTKGTLVHSILPTATLNDVVHKLVDQNCGSLVVCEPTPQGGKPRLIGIITERDILRACAAGKTPLDRYPVSSSMTANPFTARLSDTIEDAMDLITEKRIRHLPIVENDELVGLVSIGDLVKARQHLAEVENHYLKSYIHG